MARSHRLFLTQDDYLNACIKEAQNSEHLGFRLCTWGVSRVTAGSRIASLLTYLHLRGNAEILVGLSDLGMASKVAGIARQYSRIKWRYSDDTHAKYFLWKKTQRTNVRWSREWFGFMGSCNLSDSKIWNIGYSLPSLPASELALQHELYWKEGSDMMTILKRMNGGLQQLMSGTIRQPNDTGNSGVLPTQPWRK